MKKGKYWPMRATIGLSWVVPVVLVFPLAGQAQDELRAYRQVAFESGHGTASLKKGLGDDYFALNHFDHCVWKFSGSGSTSGRISSAGMGPADLLSPKDLAVNVAGEVIVADNGSGLIKIFSQGGDLLSSFHYPRPQHVAVLSDGRILVSGFPKDSLISVFDRRGKTLGEIGVPAKIVDIPFLNAVHNAGSMVVNKDDDIFFVFRYMLRPTIRKYRPDGTLVAEWYLEGGEVLEKNIERARADYEKNLKSGPNAGHYGGVPILTAAAFDEETKNLWVASGQQLMQLDSSGHTVRTVKLELPDGRPLPVEGIIVGREVIQASSFLAGVFEFSKPH